MATTPATVQMFIDTETVRLQDKKKQVDDILSSQSRTLQLNESYRKRYAEYTKIVIAFVLSIAAILAMLLITRALPIFPDGLFDFISIVILFIFVLYSWQVYSDIQRRSLMQFDELNVPAKAKTTEEEKKAADAEAVKTGDLLSTALGQNNCVGQACCDSTVIGNNSTVWDAGKNKCVLKSAFTTLSQAYNTGEYKEVAPNAMDEFDKYAPYAI